MKIRGYFILILLASLIFSGCTAKTANSTPTPNVEQTAQFEAAKDRALQTIQAEITATTKITPTEISQPAITPTPTVTLIPSATQYVYQPPTATPIPAFECELISFSPEFNAVYRPNVDFDARWNIKNIGTEEWVTTDIDFIHIHGPKMHTGPDIVDLEHNLKPGESNVILMDMYAPKTPGIHQDMWVLSHAGETFCIVTVTIEVVE